ncbi:hypothetical protein CONPUDRAFT_96921 [Coniophora puteana RWD-64-598 SS2]|uniref:Wax synthase domain-containing protein n=1 Tax=Coniophora puteana (strain RWD-64-598) TaxID=741705 RepID=A0A5M3MZM3_CONPW|nr:uncharacterized protein CONPUDRAFT_96921 [Coniophora puteana RWD-64-598 SS2]EIW84613.1 hypothetical protein CONPUDRAFT_96921 [Coniophora puteana RWD-64-598 SS2]
MSSTSPVELLRPILSLPSERLPLTWDTAALYVAPPLVCYFVMAILVIQPNTLGFRRAVLPVALVLALRGCLAVDIYLTYERLGLLNLDVILGLLTVSVRMIDWSLFDGPLVRTPIPCSTPLKQVASETLPEAIPSKYLNTVVDAIDLTSGFRDIGWSSSKNFHVPPSPPNQTKTSFCLRTSASVAVHGLLCACVHALIQASAPDSIGTPSGGTIFDRSLPPIPRFARSSILSVLSATLVYAVLRWEYEIFAVLAVSLAGQDPAQWPPAFDEPWRSTSLREFWGRRWHQLLRQVFLVAGSYPLAFIGRTLAGRTGKRMGYVLGAFGASGVYHYVGLLSLSADVSFWQCMCGFTMMGVGMVLEDAFITYTGRKVSGVLGWIWTFGWTILWGNMLVDAFASAGMMGSATLLDGAASVGGIWAAGSAALGERMVRIAVSMERFWDLWRYTVA